MTAVEKNVRPNFAAYSDRVHFLGPTLHLSRDLLSHPNFGELWYWARREGLDCILHEPPEFAEKFCKSPSELKVGENEVQRYVLRLFEDAFERRAQDIHVLNTGLSTRIRMRILGDLSDYDLKDASFGEQLMNVLYNYFAQQTGSAVFSRLERMDGRILNPEVLPEGIFAVRLHAEPVQSAARDTGIFMTLRLLYDTDEITGDLAERLSGLGFLPEQTEIFEQLTLAGGLVVVSGATGHGKSTLLRHVFEAMVEERPEQCYLSVEDPPEYRIRGVQQVQVDSSGGSTEERGKSFREAIAGALRADPDVLMIGEIRDGSACEAAVAGALSGHAVWASLHARDAISSLCRLVSLLSEVRPQALEMLADPAVLTALTHQRLLPVLCPKCKKSYREEALGNRGRKHQRRLEAALEGRLDSVCIRGDGCQRCQGRGVVAMTLASEILVMNSEIRRLFATGRSGEIEAVWQQSGGRRVREIALDKVARGLVDPLDCELRLQSPL